MSHAVPAQLVAREERRRLDLARARVAVEAEHRRLVASRLADLALDRDAQLAAAAGARLLADTVRELIATEGPTAAAAFVARRNRCALLGALRRTGARPLPDGTWRLRSGHAVDFGPAALRAAIEQLERHRERDEARTDRTARRLRDHLRRVRPDGPPAAQRPHFAKE